MFEAIVRSGGPYIVRCTQLLHMPQSLEVRPARGLSTLFNMHAPGDLRVNYAAYPMAEYN